MSKNPKLSNDKVLKAGFTPLGRTMSAPSKQFPLGRSSFDNRLPARESFNGRAGSPEKNKAQQQASWDSNPWKPMVRVASFDSRAGSERQKRVANSPAFTSLERKESFKRREEAVVIVDPFSSGALLAEKVVAGGRHCVRVFAEFESPVASFVSEAYAAVQYDATLQHDDRSPDVAAAADTTAAALSALPWPIVAVLPGAETGVELADRLAVRLGTRNNGEELCEARRNKFIMGETVRAAGVRAVQQTKAKGWGDVERFLRDWNPDPFVVVVKPIQSAGSDDVFKCTSLGEVRAAFDKINGSANMLGVLNEGVLVQEFLDGTEYVIDSVSRDGVHKVTAIWEYDKRSVNDANFVYFGMSLRPATGELERQLIEYSDSVLDALGIVNGPGHMEVKVCRDGPCLVEVGSRCHGGEGSWVPVAEECVGYHQIGATLDVYVDPDAFEALPAAPTQLHKSGCEVFLVARQTGLVRQLPGVDAIRALRSFRHMELAVQPGMKQCATIDCFTRPGAVELVHDDDAVLAADVEVIRGLEVDGLFEFARPSEQ
jgi:biotin carboxylase